MQYLCSIGAQLRQEVGRYLHRDLDVNQDCIEHLILGLVSTFSLCDENLQSYGSAEWLVCDSLVLFRDHLRDFVCFISSSVIDHGVGVVVLRENSVEIHQSACKTTIEPLVGMC
jgi:hypothetical protein